VVFIPRQSTTTFSIRMTGIMSLLLLPSLLGLFQLSKVPCIWRIATVTRHSLHRGAPHMSQYTVSSFGISFS